jgi:hypothetical protein
MTKNQNIEFYLNEVNIICKCVSDLTNKTITPEQLEIELALEKDDRIKYLKSFALKTYLAD